MEPFLASRLTALKVIERIIDNQKTLQNVFEDVNGFNQLPESDKMFCRLLVFTVLRRLGQIDAIIGKFVSKPIPEKRRFVRLILALGIAQIIYLETPPYAAVDVCVRLSRCYRQHDFSGFINGVLRNVVRQKETLSKPDELLNIPSWLVDSWKRFYPISQIKLFAQMFVQEAPLDISVKENSLLWAQRFNGETLLTGTVRTVFNGDISRMEGYDEGSWWVQEASACIPAQLFPAYKGLHIADLCAAPGGKTAQLAVQGAIVDAFDISKNRLLRLQENMKRLKLEENVCIKQADVATLTGSSLYDAVLLDAPCSATGTIRRHPDLLYHRTQKDVVRLSETQKCLLKKAIDLTKAGGYIVYSTCSLEWEENEGVVQDLLKQYQNIKRVTLADKWKPYLNNEGAIQVTPDKNQDGFYAVLLKKA